MSNKRVLIACYGGGHVQSLIPIAQALQQNPLVDLTVVGFNTARVAFERAGILATSYTDIARYMESSCEELVPQFAQEAKHPDVTDSETFAYYHVGLHDLIKLFGEEVALEMVRKQGRSAFYPKPTLTRYLEEKWPDLLITSTSPRSELALQRAAAELGILGLAVSDLFLTDEAESYLCKDRYASDVTVLCDYVAELLRRQAGLRSRLHVTGNPAFDPLFSEESRRCGQEIRKRFSLGSEVRLVTWFSNSLDNRATQNPFNLEFLDNLDVLRHLKAISAEHTNLRVAVRPHPNLSSDLSGALEGGVMLGKEYPIEGVVWASDVVVVENSTVGFQAAMIGRQVLTIGPAAYAPYIELGIATHIPVLSDLHSAFDDQSPARSSSDIKLGIGVQPNATSRVLQVIDNMLHRKD